MQMKKLRAKSHDSADTNLSNNRKRSPFNGANSQFNQDDATTAISLNNYASTSDISIILDEKEKRLQTKEELVKCKERLLDVQTQNERLKREISVEKSQNFSHIQSNYDGYQEKAQAFSVQSGNLY